MKTNVFLSGADLYDLNFSGLSPDLSFLFVTIDSCRMSSENCFNVITSQLDSQDITYLWNQNGLWLSYSDFTNPIVASKIIVPFSAACLYTQQPLKLPMTRFNQTTDSGESFSPDEVMHCVSEIKRIGALGYVADGVGLQCVSCDDRLSHCFSLLARNHIDGL